MRPVERIIDANANRAREALRVLEEAARFLLDDAEAAQACKAIRHDLTEAVTSLELTAAARDTLGDVGCAIVTPAETTRADASAVVAAAGKRLGEALRVLEEYGKTIDATFASRIETLRYRGYAVEQTLTAALGSMRPVQWRVCVLLTEALCGGRTWEWVAERAIEGGADCIQLREKALGDRELLARAARLVELAENRAAVVINDRPDIALAAGAHGVHLGQGDLPCDAARRVAGRRLVIGVSTSRLEEAEAARRAGADYCGVGPMFPTTTKDKPHLAGPAYLERYLEWDGLPHLAIGGIDAGNIGALVVCGVRGVAVSAAVCGAEDPATVIRALRESIDG